MNDFEARGKRPQYMHFIFGKSDFGCTPSVTYTESAAAVPSVPMSDYHYTNITNTIQSYPHLFPIITPINADRLEHLLCNHPNSELVHSICHGLRSGFWPYADTASPDSIPQGSVSRPHGLLLLDDASQDFLILQCDTEISLGCYSEAFGSQLLPGMVAQPIFTVPKKALIPTEGGFVVLDNLSDLGANI